MEKGRIMPNNNFSSLNHKLKPRHKPQHKPKLKIKLQAKSRLPLTYLRTPKLNHILILSS